MRLNHTVCLRLTLFVLLQPLACVLHGQISPGPLSKAHQSLSGTLDCGKCHVFGAGASRLRCLACHGEIRAKVTNKEGYHGRVVNRAKGDVDCARCHTEHYGVDFNIVRWPESRDEFDHRLTGYPLEGAHRRLRCEQCHQPSHIRPEERTGIRVKDLRHTYLGLSPACLNCHQDVHRGELGADCARCHNLVRWKPAAEFDHEHTQFPLTGKHQGVQCSKCHRAAAAGVQTVQYKGVSMQCAGCHQDPHHGAFAPGCQSCHDTTSWKRVVLSRSFDHGRTNFPLNGKHAGLGCFKCHKDVDFKAPVAHKRCLDCHQDAHRGQFGPRDCADCHTERDFHTSTFSSARHQATKFPLQGKHAAVECAKCHLPAGRETDYHPRFQACIDCHRNPHENELSRCENCHTVDSFRPSTFTLSRHQDTRFALLGAHAAVSCGQCHLSRYRFAQTTCESCHRDPHNLGASGNCETCHSLKSWHDLKQFDHGTTRFALTGAHRATGCLDCHRVRPGQPQFAQTSGRCADCHQDVHGAQFDRAGETANCGACHNTGHWADSIFDHEKHSTFSLSGAHSRVPCRMCHPSRREGGRVIVIYRGTPRACDACHS